MMYLGKNAVGINNEKFSYPLRYVHTGRNLYNSETLPDIFVVDFTGNTNIDGFDSTFNNTKCEDTIIIRGLKPSSQSFTFQGCFWSCTAKKIIFDNCEVAPTNFNYSFRQMKNLTEIVGELDFTNATTASSMFYETGNITSIHFKPNSISVSIGNSAYLSKIDDDSLISLCNGFNSNVSNTFQFHSTITSGRLSTLMGNNVNDLFVADENGSISLQDFITNVKGWTIS